MKCASSLKLVVVLSILTAQLSGCASFSGAESKQNLQQLKYGMSEDKVLNLLGTPDSVTATNETEDRWIYEYKREDKRGHNIFLQFKDGKLVKTGELNGREIAAANENRTSGVCTHRMHPDTVQESLCIK